MPDDPLNSAIESASDPINKIISPSEKAAAYPCKHQGCGCKDFQASVASTVCRCLHDYSEHGIESLMDL